MTRLLFSLFALSVLFSSPIQAQDHDHSAEICSALNAQVCAHLGHFQGFTSTTASEFIFHAMTPNQEELKNLKIELWMPEHGHGSSPVTLTSVGLNKYQVSQAFFVMAGPWIVRTQFEVAGQNHKLEFPVEITE